MAKWYVYLTTTIERGFVVEAETAEEAEAAMRDRLAGSAQTNDGRDLFAGAVDHGWEYSSETLAASGAEDLIRAEEAPFDADCDLPVEVSA